MGNWGGGMGSRGRGCCWEGRDPCAKWSSWGLRPGGERRAMQDLVGRLVACAALRKSPLPPEECKYPSVTRHVQGLRAGGVDTV